MDSSVAFIRRFNSIFSSNAPSTAAIASCSARGGSVIERRRWSVRLKYGAMSVDAFIPESCSINSTPWAQ